jgi:hypothetical protein
MKGGWADFSSARGAKFSSGTAEDGRFSVLLEAQSSVQELKRMGSYTVLLEEQVQFRN